MVADQNIGARVRERRQGLGLKQTELAASAGISAAYLNLIEHGRRRLSSKLLQSLAAALDTTPQALGSGRFDEVARALARIAQEVDAGPGSVEDPRQMMRQFPAWAALTAKMAKRLESFEAAVANASNQLFDNPRISGAMHEMISTATSIRSTASILTGEESLDRDWLRRFHNNIHEDSRRLTDSSRILAAFLETTAPRTVTSASEALLQILAECDHQFPEVADDPAAIEQLSASLSEGLPNGTSELLAQWLTILAVDNAAFAPEVFERVARQHDFDPLAVMQETRLPPDRVLCRLGRLPRSPGTPTLGYISVDGAGGVRDLRGVPGFELPRSSAACPVWPIFRGAGRPGEIRRSVIEVADSNGLKFLCYDMTVEHPASTYGGLPIPSRVMLIRTDPPADLATVDIAGRTCRFCSHATCALRREPSVL
jgi:transcriptional regulator with XRE-family HTH domain